MFQAKFQAKMVSADPTYQRTKPCRVVRVRDNYCLGRYESRTDCARALNIQQGYVSLLIYGQTKMKLIDEKHGELKILDGKYSPKTKKKSKK